jgi:TP901 family phage tail tape measure protein
MAQNMLGNTLAKIGIDAQAAMSGSMGVAGLATAAVVGLGAGVAAVGVASIKAASTFQTQMARISGLTGSSTEQVKYYQQQILALSPTWDMSATDAAKALYFIISAGFSGSKAIDVLNYSAKSATASLADQATVADALTSMLNAYKDSNISAAEAANDLTKIEIYGKAQLGSFASSLGFTMVTAHAAGISISEASAAVADLSQVSGNHGIRRRHACAFGEQSPSKNCSEFGETPNYAAA